MQDPKRTALAAYCEPNAQLVSKKSWVMKRNCAISPRQLGVFYLSLLLASLCIAGVFAYFGAWMVLPFAGLELLVLGAALYVYARHAADYEYVELEDTGLLRIEQASAYVLKRYEWNASWVRLVYDGAPQSLVSLRSKGQSVDIGKFLLAHQRADFAKELSWLLRQK